MIYFLHFAIVLGGTGRRKCAWSRIIVFSLVSSVISNTKPSSISACISVVVSDIKALRSISLISGSNSCNWTSKSGIDIPAGCIRKIDNNPIRFSVSRDRFSGVIDGSIKIYSEFFMFNRLVLFSPNGFLYLVE